MLPPKAHHPILWIIRFSARSNSSSELFIGEFLSVNAHFSFLLRINDAFSFPYHSVHVAFGIDFFSFVRSLAVDCAEFSSHITHSMAFCCFRFQFHYIPWKTKCIDTPSRFDSRSISYCVKCICSVDCRWKLFIFIGK